MINKFNNSNNTKNEVLSSHNDTKQETVQKNEINSKNLSKKIFGLSIFEVLLLIFDILSVITIFIFFDTNWLSFSVSLIGCFAILFLAKGFFFAPAFNVVYDILYIILSYSSKYFGEAIIYILVTLPIDFYASFSWKKSKSKESDVIIINRLSKKEWIIFGIVSAISAIIVYFILKSIGNEEVFISTITFITSGMAGYLLIRKNNLYSLVYSIYDLFCILLWTIPIFHGELSNIPMVVNFIFSFLIESYGFFNLKKELKFQNNTKAINN